MGKGPWNPGWAKGRHEKPNWSWGHTRSLGVRKSDRGGGAQGDNPGKDDQGPEGSELGRSSEWKHPQKGFKTSITASLRRVEP